MKAYHSCDERIVLSAPRGKAVGSRQNVRPRQRLTGQTADE
jgi:hypothetical protein